MTKYWNCPIRSYEKASEVVDSNRGKRKIANNTYARRVDENTVAIKFHHTDIVTWHSDESYTLNTGGWWTMSTHERMKRYTPTIPWSERKENGRFTSADGWWWFTQGATWDKRCHPFRDGMRVYKNGRVEYVHNRRVGPTCSGITGVSPSGNTQMPAQQIARVNYLEWLAKEFGTVGGCAEQRYQERAERRGGTTRPAIRFEGTPSYTDNLTTTVTLGNAVVTISG